MIWCTPASLTASAIYSTRFDKTHRPREADPETAARAKVLPKNLVVNGGFEAAGDQPRGWEPVDNLTMFLAAGEKRHIDARSLIVDTEMDGLDLIPAAVALAGHGRSKLTRT